LMFATGKSNLRPTSREKLAGVAEALQSAGEKQIVVEGHTDSMGSEELNMQLSQKRAETVADFLVAEGVPEARVSAMGVGPASPIGDNSTPEGRAENRRVEIIIQPMR
jgi:outer membrane protein OmpA-like peptidoglycan-associated protein